MAESGDISGAKEFDRFIDDLPKKAAQHLQNTVASLHAKHRKEILRTSTFSAEAKRRLRFVIKFKPDELKHVRRIRDVQGETYSNWRGYGELNAKEGMARIVDKRVGKATLKPKRGRFLLIPVGDMVTKTGRPRRTRGTIPGGGSGLVPLQISELPNVAIVRIKGRLLAIQHLKAGERGQFESATKGVRKNRTGDRSRIVGVLKTQVPVKQGLDFFGSWDRLESERRAAFDRMLDRVARGEPARSQKPRT